MRERLEESAMPLNVLIKSAGSSMHRVKGTSVFLSASPNSVPTALLHNMKHNQVLHQRVMFLTIQVEDVPHVAPENRAEVTALGDGFYRVVLHYGFVE